jgi:hypothetical protein
MTTTADHPTTVAATRSADESDALIGALTLMRSAGAEYDGFLTNHGPMAAEAIVQLGHADRVLDWARRYVTQLEAPAPESRRVTDSNWRDALGDMSRLGDWTVYFHHAVGEVSWSDLLTVWWPRLIAGAGGGATHGLIRTAHAVRSLASSGEAHDALLEELGSGLAYWSARYATLPGRPTLDGRDDALHALHLLPRLPTSTPSQGDGIMGRLAALGTVDDFADSLDTYGGHDAPSDIDELIRVVATLIATRTDATIALCHAVTAPAAIQMTLPHLPAEHHEPGHRAAWQVVAAIVAAFTRSTPTTLPSASGIHVPLAEDLARHAIDHGDEHVIKLTEACVRQFARTADPILLVAADRFRSRISRPA